MLKKLIYLALPVLIFGCTSPKSTQQNNVKISRIMFESGECSNKCPSFQLQIDRSKRILFNGLTSVEKTGYYIGSIDGVFWDYLVNKIHYTDLQHLKSQYGENSDDNQTLKLEIDTDKGTYRCTISDSNRAPAALKDLVRYILNNYRKIDLKPLDIENMFQSEGSSRRKMINEMLEKIPC